MIRKQGPSTWADYRNRARLFWLLLLVGPIAALAAGAFWLVEHVGLHGLGWPLAAWLVAPVSYTHLTLPTSDLV